MKNATLGTDTLLIAPVAITAAATAGATIDTVGADFATIRVGFASEVNTNAIGPTISLLHNDTTVITDFVTVLADRTGEDLVADRPLIYHVDMRSRKRYLRLKLTAETHTTNDLIVADAWVTLTRKSEQPASTTDMVASGGAVVLV